MMWRNGKKELQGVTGKMAGRQGMDYRALPERWQGVSGEIKDCYMNVIPYKKKVCYNEFHGVFRLHLQNIFQDLKRDLKRWRK